MTMEEDKSILVFEMLVERLSALEMQNSKIVQNMKDTCIAQKMLRKNLFDYKIDVRLLDETSFVFKKEVRVLVEPCQYSNGCDMRFLCLADEDDYKKVENILNELFNNSQMQKIKDWIQYRNTIENGDCKRLTCKELNIDTIFVDVEDYVLNKYLNKMTDNKLACFMPATSPCLILQNVSDVDEVMDVLAKLENAWDSLKFVQGNPRDNISLLSLYGHWWKFYLMLTADDNDFDMQNHVSEASLNTFMDYLHRLEHGKTTTEFELLQDKSDIQYAQKTIRKMLDNA